MKPIPGGDKAPMIVAPVPRLRQLIVYGYNPDKLNQAIGEWMEREQDRLDRGTPFQILSMQATITKVRDREITEGVIDPVMYHFIQILHT